MRPQEGELATTVMSLAVARLGGSESEHALFHASNSRRGSEAIAKSSYSDIRDRHRACHPKSVLPNSSFSRVASWTYDTDSSTKNSRRYACWLHE